MANRKSRIAQLEEHVTQAEKPGKRVATYTVYFKGEMQDFPVIRVKTAFPLLRVQSGRTHRAQSQYIAKHPKLDPEFFKDPEDPAVQKAQSEILLKMIDDAGLNEDLEDRPQEKPIVLTHDGYIVDGNRRVTALRDQDIEYVKAVVLPEATDQEIYDTELWFQMARETKAPYHWVDELLHIHWGVYVLNEDSADIAKRMRKDPKEITADLARLSVIDMYLEHVGKKGQYHEVPNDSAQAFKDLAQKINKREFERYPVEQQETLKKTCFDVIANPHEEGKLYEAVRAIWSQITTNAAELVERLEEHPDFPDPPPTPTKKSGRQAKLGALDELVDEEHADASPAIAKLSAVFAKRDISRKAVNPLVETALELQAARSAATKSDPIQLIHKALRELEKVEVSSGYSKRRELGRVISKLRDETDRIAKAFGAK